METSANKKIIKIISYLLCFMTFFTMSRVVTSNAYYDTDQIDCEGKIQVEYTDSTPVLDGTEEAIWKKAKQTDISEIVVSSGESGAAEGKIKLMWNGAFLYIFCEVTDANVCASDSIGEDNDCVRIILTENPEIKDKNDPENGNLDFLIYSRYKEEEFGKDINNNLRDYVAAEYKTTEKGYNVEAIVKLSRMPMLGDEFVFGAEIFSISDENGEITGKTQIKSESSVIVFTDGSGIYPGNAGDMSVLTADMTYGYTEEEIEDMIDRYNPYIICLFCAENNFPEKITEKYKDYSKIETEESNTAIIYRHDILKASEICKIGKKGDCAGCFMTNLINGESFYIFGTKLEEKYSAERRAQASEIRSEINLKNKYGYPVILCAELSCGNNSFTYDIFAMNGLEDAVKKTDDTVCRYEDTTFYVFLSEESLEVPICRMISSGEGESKKQGAMFAALALDSKIDASSSQRRTAIYIAEGVLTAAIAAGISIFLYKKSKGKEEKC